MTKHAARSKSEHILVSNESGDQAKGWRTVVSASRGRHSMKNQGMQRKAKEAGAM